MKCFNQAQNTTTERKIKQMNRKTTKRIYGNINDLQKTTSNTTATYYRLYLYIKDNYGDYVPLSIERGFNGYTKKQIYKELKSELIYKYNL